MGRLARDGQGRQHFRQYRSFEDARAFVRGLGLKSKQSGLHTASQTRSRMIFRVIQIDLMRTMAGPAMGDWLGTGFVAFPPTPVSIFRQTPALSCAGSV